MKQNFYREKRLLLRSVKNQLKSFKWNIAFVLGCLLLSKASSFGIPFLLKSIIDDLSLKNNPIESIAFALPISLIVAYGLLNIAHILFKDLKDYLSTKEPLKNCRFAQQSFKKSGRKFQYLAIFSSKQPVFLEN